VADTSPRRIGALGELGVGRVGLRRVLGLSWPWGRVGLGRAVGLSWPWKKWGG